jgi:transcriptional regulator with XRE-family HTH domain
MVHVHDFSRRDEGARRDLKVRLLSERHRQRLGQRAVAARLGIDQRVFSGWEKRDQWRMTTVMRWARALDMQFKAVPTGFPEPEHATRKGRAADIDDALIDLLANVGTRGDEWDVARLQSRIATLRAGCGVTQKQVADILSVTPQAIGEFECGSRGALLVNAQRHTRAVAQAAGLESAYLALTLVYTDGDVWWR